MVPRHTPALSPTLVMVFLVVVVAITAIALWERPWGSAPPPTTTAVPTNGMVVTLTPEPARDVLPTKVEPGRGPDGHLIVETPDPSIPTLPPRLLPPSLRR